MANFRSVAALFAAFSMLAGSSAYAAGQSNADVASESVDIAFDYQRGGIASSQYAIWVEDEAGPHAFCDTFYSNAWLFRASRCRADLGG